MPANLTKDGDCGQARHWFTRYGWVGVHLKLCARNRCGVVNPRWPEYVEAARLGRGEIGGTVGNFKLKGNIEYCP